MALNKKNNLPYSHNFKHTNHTNSQCALKDQLDGKKIDPKIFGAILRTICMEFDFKVLLEIPAQMIDENSFKEIGEEANAEVVEHSFNQNSGTAIAILCPNKNDYSILFAICKSSRHKIRIVDEKFISASIVELACSYAALLSLLPKSAYLETAQ